MEIAILFALIVLNGLFAMSEISLVTARKADPRGYGVLAELNTRPRTTYLGRVLNLAPELEDHG